MKWVVTLFLALLFLNPARAQTLALNSQPGYMSPAGQNGCPSTSACFVAYGSTLPTTSGAGSPLIYKTQSTVENVQIGYMSPAGQNGCPSTNACFVAYGATVPTSSAACDTIATTLILGCIKPDGVTITVNGSGVASAIGAASASITVGTTTIGGGTIGKYLYHGASDLLAEGTFGTDVATALAVNIGSAGAPVLFNGAGGTPSSITLTNAGGTAASLTAGVATLANGLKSATTTVVVSSATAPTLGQVLTATSGTAADWETPASGAATSITPGTTTIVGATAPCLIANSATTVMACDAVSSGALTAMANTVNASNGLLTYGILGTSGAVVGLLNGNLTFSGNDTFSGTLVLSGLSAGTIAAGKNLGLDSSNNLVTATVSGASGANPTGTAGPTAVNGSASTFLRSDGAPAVQKGSNAQFGIVEGDGQTVTCVVGVCSSIASTRSASGPTIATTDMGGTIWATGGTVTIPAISTGLFDAKQTVLVVNTAGTTRAVSSTPTVEAGGNCVTATGIPAGYAWQIQSNNTTLDCLQVVSAAPPGTGTVNAGTAGQMAYYASSTDAVSGNADATISNGSLTLGVANTTIGKLLLEGNTSGVLTIAPQATAGTPTWTAGTSSGTPAVTASAPLVITTATGDIACATCVTSAAALTSGAIVVGGGSQASATDASATLTAGALSLGASGTVGTVALGNATSGTVTLGTVTGALGSVTASLPANTGTIAELNLAQSWTAPQRTNTETPTISTATFTPVFSTGQNHRIVLVHANCPCTLANPAALVAGQSGMFEIVQSSTGSDTIGTWGSEYIYAGGTSAITLSTGANAVDYLPYIVDSTGSFIVLGGIISNPTH